MEPKISSGGAEPAVAAVLGFIGQVPEQDARNVRVVGELLYRKAVDQVRNLGCLSHEGKRHTFFLVGHSDLAVSTSLSSFPMHRITNDTFLYRASNALGKPLAGHAVIHPGMDGKMHWLLRWGRSWCGLLHSDVMARLPALLEGSIWTFFRCVNRIGGGRCRGEILTIDTPDAALFCPECTGACGRERSIRG